MKRVTDSGDKVTIRAHRTPSKSVATSSSLSSSKEAGSGFTFSSPTNKKSENRFQALVSERKRGGICETNVSVKQISSEKRPKTMGNVTAKDKVERRKANRFVFGRHGDFINNKEDYLAQKAFNAMEERCNCTLEQLEATEMELNELRRVLQEFAKKNAELQTDILEYQKTVNTLNGELDRCRDEQLKVASNASKLSAASDDKENLPTGNDETQLEIDRLQENNKNLAHDNRALKQQVKKLEEEVEEAWRANEELNSKIEAERMEWESLKADLLVAVKVANDFKVEAQQEKQDLLAKIIELQDRRLSSASLSTVQSLRRSLSALAPSSASGWEDVAWDKLSTEPTSGKNPTRFNALLQWCRFTLKDYSDVEVTNFSSSWADGRAFCYLLASFFPQKFDLKKINLLNSAERLQLAFDVGREVGVQRQISVDDIVNSERPPWGLLMPYILNVYYVARCL